MPKPSLLTQTRDVVIDAAAVERHSIPPHQLTRWKSDLGDRIQTVEVSELWTEEALDGKWADWVVAARFVPDDRGQPVIAEVRVFPKDARRVHSPGRWAAEFLGVRATETVPRGGIPATLLRRAILLREHEKFTSEIFTSLSHASEHERIASTVEGPKSAGFVVAATPAAEKKKMRGRPRVWSEADLAQIAHEYEAAVQSGLPIIKTIAAARVVSEANARNLVSKARALGLLPAAIVRGRRGGVPSPTMKQAIARLTRRRAPRVKGGK